MTALSDTIARLSAIRDGLGQTPEAVLDRLTDIVDFGSDPGALRARTYVPAGLADGAALVVVMHGCTQNAAVYDHGSGWSRLADRHGFALLFPEQRRSNNFNLCFNWFQTEDMRRDGGEPLSIRQMIAAMVARHPIDPARIFVTGLSAGGAMTSVMLATWPELFAGGAIIAGLPYGTAASTMQALDRMRGAGGPDEEGLAAAVRAASDHQGPWPTISIWHGTDDATVVPSNAEAIFRQWRALHGVAPAPTRVESVDGHPRRIWCDRGGRVVIEDYSIDGMGHGTPLDTLGEDGDGVSGPHMIEAGISSTRHIARFWGLLEAVDAAPPSSRPTPRPRPAPAPVPTPASIATPAPIVLPAPIALPTPARPPVAKPKAAPTPSPMPPAPRSTAPPTQSLPPAIATFPPTPRQPEPVPPPARGIRAIIEKALRAVGLKRPRQ